MIQILSLYSSVCLDNCDEMKLKLLEEMLRMKKTILGLDHRDTLRSMLRFACFHHDHGKYEDAIAFGEQALCKSTKTLGAEHKDTLRRIEGLANSYSKQVRFSDELFSRKGLEKLKG